MRAAVWRSRAAMFDGIPNDAEAFVMVEVHMTAGRALFSGQACRRWPARWGLLN